MPVAGAWTGRSACALQAALRLTNESFAAHLGVAVRTVAAWHQKPDLTPRTEMQQLLDTVLEQASPSVRARFAAIAAGDDPDEQTGDAVQGYGLTVAISVVVNESDVLIVQRRGADGQGISWQFPAGVVKPGIAPELVAVRETLGETGVHCSVSRDLGGRLHPVTNVFCEYLLCDYLAGEAENMDQVENVSVTWAAIKNLHRFIPAEHVFPPVLEALETHSE